MVDGIRKFVRERFERISSRRPEDLARSVAQQGQAAKEQATRVAGDVAQWSKKNLELITEVVKREVPRQIARLGVATRDEISALRRRVRDLEAGGGARKTAAKRAPGRKTAARKPAAKKATATKAAAPKKVSARKPAGRTASAKKAAGRKSARPARRA
jgi:polyhydroxyalkanoate synthesis regulator phasin